MNFIQIAGFLGADAEERSTTKGKRVIHLRVATKVRQGGKDETIWWRANIWGDRFEKMLPYLKKGTPIVVLGELEKPTTYVDKNGVTQISLTVNAEIIRFSPFGRPEKEAGSSMGQAAGQPLQDPFSHASMGEEMAGYGAGMKGQSSFDDGFTGDDLPF